MTRPTRQSAERSIDESAAVARRTAELVEAASAGDEGAIEALIDGAFEYLDRGLGRTAKPIIDALDGLRNAERLTRLQQGWLLNIHARIWFSDTAYGESQASLEDAIAIAETEGDPALMATTLLNLGNVRWVMGDPAGAAEAFEDTLPLRPKGDEFGRAQTLLNLAGARLDTGDVAGSQAALELAERIPAAKRGRLRPTLMGVQGLLDVERGDLVGAERNFRGSVAAAARSGLLEHEAIALQNLGAVTLDLGRPRLAARRLRRAERFVEAAHVVRILEGVQRTLATALVRAGRPADAFVVLDRAEAAATSRGDRSITARIVADRGALLMLGNRFGEAVPVLLNAWQLVGKEDESLARAIVQNIVVSQVRSGDEAGAFRTVLEFVGSLSEDARATFEESIGDALLREGQFPAAERMYNQGARSLGGSPVTTRNYLAEVASKIGDSAPEMAVRFFDAALEVKGAEHGIATYRVLNDRGITLAATSRSADAVRDLQDALHQATGAGDRAMRRQVLRNLSEVLRRVGMLADAARYAEQAVSESQEKRDPLEEAASRASLGLAFLGLERWDDAREEFSSSSRIAANSHDRETQAIALGGLAQVEFVRGHFRRARRLYQRAQSIEVELEARERQTETVSALIELDALLRDQTAYESDLQALIDLVQKEDGTLDVAMNGVARAARVWLGTRGNDGATTAGETFAIGILLGLWETGRSTADELPPELARAFIAPFIYSAASSRNRIGLVERAITRTVRDKIGKRAARFVETMLLQAREAAGEAMRNAPAEEESTAG
jgi:tetratricopeptide (TPR) repeat protein